MYENITNQEDTSFPLLIDVLYPDDLDKETLNKIKFFLTNSKINPHIIKLDIKNNLFYNIETNEVYEIIKNQYTNQYEIIRHNKVYENNQTQTNELRRLNPKNKVRVRKIELKPYMNNSAFTKIGFLIISIITFTLLITMIILLNK